MPYAIQTAGVTAASAYVSSGGMLRGREANLPCLGSMETVLAETVFANMAVYSWWCTEGLQNHIITRLQLHSFRLCQWIA